MEFHFHFVYKLMFISFIIYFRGVELSVALIILLFIQEQIEIAVEMGADFILGETYMDTGEAMLALECIKKYGKGTYLLNS